MIPYVKNETVVVSGLAAHLGITIKRTNQTAPAPAYPYGAYTVTTLASANNGTWQRHPDGKDRKLVRSIWSLSFMSDDNDQSVQLAVKARDWLEHTGRTYLKDHDIIVQSTTEITNRDNVLTAGYEYKNGFDVVFYVYDEVENPVEETGYIETLETQTKSIN